nr:reverse transcriptase domain-containing protein [Tanacetum cinerariifolium]
VDFEADSRVPLILRRSFLRTGRALINVYGEEMTLRVNDEAVTFNINQTTRYSSTYDDLSVNRIDIIDVAREEYAQEILGFSNNSSGGNPTSTSEPIIFYSSLSLTPFEGSDFILEEIEAYLKDESISPEIDHADFKAKSSIEEPPELMLKDLPSHLEYAYLEGKDKLPVIIEKDLKVDEKEALLKVLKSHKREIAWKITGIKGIDPWFCTHKILMEEDYKPAIQSQRRVTQKFMGPWVSPIYCVPKKRGITVVENENNELIPTRLVTGWRFCINYRKLNDATRKDHFPLPFMDQMLERLARNEFYCFLDGFSGYFQIPINPPDQEKTTFTCTYGTFAYRRMPFGLCNAPRTFQRCMMAIFHDIIEKTMKVFMDDFSVFGDSYSSCLSHLDTMLQRFIQDFAKIPRPMTYLLEKETLFVFSKDCIDAFETLKKKLTESSILVFPDWNLPFELMCDASDFAIGAVLLLQEFDIIIRDKKGTVNLAADHLSRPENLHKDVFENKEINENFPLETLVMLKYGVTHRLATAYHPQTSGKVEVSNRGLKRILERTVGKKPCLMKLQLNELNELRDQAYENSLIYKEKTKKIHDSKIKNCIFNVGDRVLLFNYRLKIFSGKLKTRWSGPFTITKVFPYGSVELSQPDSLNFQVNGHRVKLYFGGDVP